MSETAKSHDRRVKNGDFDRFFKGTGLDIGCGDSPLLGAIPFDKNIGLDAHDLSMYNDEHFDFVYSSHCLEHLLDPARAVNEWWRVIKKEGFLCIVVPDFRLYEKRKMPSQFNKDHKTFWTPYKLFDFALKLPGRQIMRVQINDIGFDYSDKKSDQTRKGAQSEIEIIVKKVSDLFWEDK